MTDVKWAERKETREKKAPAEKKHETKKKKHTRQDCEEYLICTMTTLLASVTILVILFNCEPTYVPRY